MSPSVARSIFLALLMLIPWRARASQALGAVNLISVTPRIITPNGDTKNDVVFFNFDQHLSGLPITGEVFDLSGARVGALSLFSDDTKMRWDGRDSAGNIVRSGIYVYQLTLNDFRLTGTVTVAR